MTVVLGLAYTPNGKTTNEGKLCRKNWYDAANDQFLSLRDIALPHTTPSS